MEVYNPPKRVKLVFTNDPYTDLKSGDLGWAQSLSKNDFFIVRMCQLSVNWDNGSKLMLVNHEPSMMDDDRWEFVD